VLLEISLCLENQVVLFLTLLELPELPESHELVLEGKENFL